MKIPSDTRSVTLSKDISTVPESKLLIHYKILESHFEAQWFLDDCLVRSRKGRRSTAVAEITQMVKQGWKISSLETDSHHEEALKKIRSELRKGSFGGAKEILVEMSPNQSVKDVETDGFKFSIRRSPDPGKFLVRIKT